VQEAVMTDEAELRDLAKRRVQARTGLAIHLVIYTIVNIALIGIWALSGAHFPWFVFPLFGWGIGVAAHVIAYFIGPGSEGEQRMIDREMQRLRARPQH
jgi:fatty acid desaturase